MMKNCSGETTVSWLWLPEDIMFLALVVVQDPESGESIK